MYELDLEVILRVHYTDNFVFILAAIVVMLPRQPAARETK